MSATGRNASLYFLTSQTSARPTPTNPLWLAMSFGKHPSASYHATPKDLHLAQLFLFCRRCLGLGLGLVELLHPFLWVFVEILHAVFAAEFHFLSFVNQRDGLARVAANDIAVNATVNCSKF